MIAATVHAFKSPIQDWRWSIGWIFLALGLAALMTSTIRFYSFKDLPWTRKQPSLGIVFIALLGAAIWRWSEMFAADCRDLHGRRRNLACHKVIAAPDGFANRVMHAL